MINVNITCAKQLTLHLVILIHSSSGKLSTELDSEIIKATIIKKEAIM